MTEDRLWYREPAELWTEALPVGNGRLGGMIWGGIDDETISLNEATLWSGFPERWYNDRALGALAEARELLTEGRVSEAQVVVEASMAGRWTQAALPPGRLRCRALSAHSPQAYRRTLNLDTATVHIQGGRPGSQWTREVFVSAADEVLVYRFRSDVSNSWGLHWESDLRGESLSEADGLSWSGVAPRFVVPSYLPSESPLFYGEDESTSGMRYCMRVRVVTDGKLVHAKDHCRVEGAREVVLLIAVATSFVDRDTHPNLHGANAEARVGRILSRAGARNYDAMKLDHVRDHRELYDRAGWEVAGNARPELATNERLRAVAGGAHDVGLAALAFHYGRYLLISCSRPGGQPSGLQGLWNQDVRPAWSGNYTVNINTQMNYWAAEVTNLPECHRPLLDFIGDVARHGEAVAARHYGARGWTAHHNLDLWAHPIPAGDDGGWFHGSACHLFWPLGGAWLSHHLWEHYAFGRDEHFLRQTAWPVLWGAARFCLDWLVPGPGETLTTMPSTSPENRYLDSQGLACSIDIGTTSDLASIRELFTEVLRAADILGVADELTGEVAAALARLPGYRRTASGALAEWSKDFAPEEPGHRHFSHLYGLYPGTQITASTADLEAAAAQSIQERIDNGGAGTGWSLAWLVCLLARLRDGDGAEAAVTRWLGGSVFANLFDLHPTVEGHPGVFQIDGNLGVTAGMAEMLLQSHQGPLVLLPALPAAWSRGRVWGLRVRGGAEVTLEWSESCLTALTIVAHRPGRWEVVYGATRTTVTLAQGQSCVMNSSLEEVSREQASNSHL